MEAIFYDDKRFFRYCSFIQKWLFSEMRPKPQSSLERYYGYYLELVDAYGLSVPRLNRIYVLPM